MSFAASLSLSKVTTVGLMLLVTLLSGLGLSYLGKPYNTAVFTVHKLTAVATIIYVGVNVYRLQQAAGGRNVLEMGLVAVTAALFVALVISGALLSIKLVLPAAVHRIHQVAPLLATGGALAALYLLTNGRS